MLFSKSLPVLMILVLPLYYLCTTLDKNHAKCDSWLESLHIFISDICLKWYSKQKVTYGFFFIYTLFLGVKKYIECTVKFTIKGANSENDIEIQ